MRQNHPNTDICCSWSPEEVEELRRSLQISDVAKVDAFAFGKKFSQIVAGGRNLKANVPLKQRAKHLAEQFTE